MGYQLCCGYKQCKYFCLGSLSTIFGILAFFWLLDWYFQEEYPVIEPPGFVVLTGASTGIGYNTALELATMGYTVFAGVRKDNDMEKLNASHENIIPIKLDITDETHIQNAVTQVKVQMEKSPGTPFAALVNNAGRMTGLPIGLTTNWEVTNLYEVNILGMIKLTNAFLPLILKNKSRVVNIGSVASFAHGYSKGVYASSKWSVLGYSHCLRTELKPARVSVSIIEPGVIGTPTVDKMLEESEDFILSDFDPLLQEFYASTIEEVLMMKHILEIEGFSDPPQIVTDAIVDAMTNKYPKDVYTVGQVAFGVPSTVIRKLFTSLPSRVMDFADRDGSEKFYREVAYKIKAKDDL